MIRYLMIGCTVLLLGAPLAVAQPSVDNQTLPYGGVVCAWRILTMMKIMGDHCFPSEQTAFKAAVNEAAERLTSFIVERSPELRTRLETKTVRYRWDIRRRPDGICFPAFNDDLFSSYRLTESFGVEPLRRSVSEVLEKTGKPQSDTCL